MNRIVALLIIALVPAFGFAQNDLLLNHHLFGQGIYNPGAVAASKGKNFMLVGRQQWVGFNEAPSSQVFYGDINMPKLGGGLGLTLVHDQLGQERALQARLSYAYRQRLGDRSSISAGVYAGILNKSLDGSKLYYDQEGDGSSIISGQSELKPDVGVGLELNIGNFTTGISTMHVNQSPESATVFQVPRHYYFYAGYVVHLSEKFRLQPSALVKSTIFTTQYDFTILGVLNNKFWFGGGFRSDDIALVMAGLNITQQLQLGYSYDFGFGEIKTNNSGSHELMLRLRLPDNEGRDRFYKSPRYFN